MTLKVRLDGAGRISLNDQPFADIQTLESVLSAESMKDPQPALRVDLESPENYEMIGKVIYLVHRVGFQGGKFYVNGKLFGG